ITLAIGRTGDKPIRVAMKEDVSLSRFGLWNAFFAAIAALLVLGFAVVGLRHANVTAVVRDGVLPQIPANRRPYSLGRLQMAFWFALVFTAFLSLWIYLGVVDTITSQALVLMGISAATGLGAIAANGANADDLSAARTALKDAGIVTEADVKGLDAAVK